MPDTMIARMEARILENIPEMFLASPFNRDGRCLMVVFPEDLSRWAMSINKLGVLVARILRKMPLSHKICHNRERIFFRRTIFRTDSTFDGTYTEQNLRREDGNYYMLIESPEFPAVEPGARFHCWYVSPEELLED